MIPVKQKPRSFRAPDTCGAFRRLAMTGLVLALLPGNTAASAAEYLKEVKPVLKAHCYACHGALKQEAGLRLDTAEAFRKGGEEGPMLREAGADILHRVTTREKSTQMPPEGEGTPLTDAEVQALREWMLSGAPGPANEAPEADPLAHWAYQSPVSTGRSLDELLNTRLSAAALKPQGEVEPGLWLRRVHIDLTGLPPSAAQTGDFLRNDSPEQRAKIVDELLSSVAYAERWARHFMDIWRYSDWYGLDAQLRNSQKHIHHWRDWIIDSLHENKGYDRMVQEMLAADELIPEDRKALRATGFLARNYYLFNRTTWLDDTIEHTSRAFLGMTMQCAKCHDHKYDPLSHVDYYQMRAVFEPLHVRLDPVPGVIDLEKDGLPRAYDLHMDRATWRHARGDEKQEDKSRPMLAMSPHAIAPAMAEVQPVKLPPPAARPALLPWVEVDQLAAAEQEKTAASDASGKTLAEQKAAMIRALIAASHPAATPEQNAAAAAAQSNYRLAEAERSVILLEQEKPGAGKEEEHNKKLQTARDSMIAARKKAETPGTTWEPLTIARKAQEGPEDNANASVQTFPDTSTGRRLAFAQWVTDTRNPLTARVLVNHLWLRHFGGSLVPDVTDFGRRCPPPLHQDILDTLAADFMQQGWDLRKLHRTMVLSALYRRSSSTASADASTLAADPDNTHYWRMNPRRLESQALRDVMLQVSGSLDPTTGGPSLDPAQQEHSVRRSLYFSQTPDVEHRFLAAFDNASVLDCYRRNESVMPQQALALSNSRLSRECSAALAETLKTLPDYAFVRQAFLLLLGRQPLMEESIAALEGLESLAQNRTLFLQVMFNHNDFITLR